MGVVDSVVRGFSVDGVYFIVTLTTDFGIVSDIKKDFTRLLNILLKIRSYEYFAMFTSEGNGVVHVLFRDCYLPKAWFESKWAFVHNSYVVHRVELVDLVDSVDYRDSDFKEAIVLYFMKHVKDGSFVGYVFSAGWLPVKVKRVSAVMRRILGCGVTYHPKRCICLDCSLFVKCGKFHKNRLLELDDKSQTRLKK